MKRLRINTSNELEKHHKEHCGKCTVVIHQGYYEVTCDKCIVSKKEHRVDTNAKAVFVPTDEDV